MMIDRIINVPKRSFFLFGPRQTGKSTLVKKCFQKKLLVIDLLNEDVFYDYLKNPSLLRKQAERMLKQKKVKYILIDEIQRVPALLNEVQSLMYNFPKCQFILTGSSARKLKRGGANLLAGRAINRHLFPFVYHEIRDDFVLDDVLQYGTLPSLYQRSIEDKQEILKAYAHTYLKEEIQSEGIVRNLVGFSKFLEMAAAQFGDLVNFSAIARECQIPKRSVQSYYEILEDTLIGLRLEPWRQSLRKRLSAHPKFYFFDNGVTSALTGRLSDKPEPILKGRLFEQWIILETHRLLHYLRSEARLFFWRTNHGTEVDLLIEKHGKLLAACEIKVSARISSSHLSGLRVFHEEHPKVPCFLISTVKHSYHEGPVIVLPWKEYLEWVQKGFRFDRKLRPSW